MSILVSFPGRYGDLLWALPTVRAISEQIGAPVDLQISGEFGGSFVDLISQQPYLHDVQVDHRWGLADWIDGDGSLQQAWQPPPIPGYDRVYSLGYRRWPELALPFETQETARREYGLDVTIDLTRPWISVESAPYTTDVACGWSDCHFELKYGLMELLHPDEDPATFKVRALIAPGSRWATEGGYVPYTWMKAAQTIQSARVFLGDNSALHVLACAIGRPVILYEPMEARHNPIFLPFGMDGPQVTSVKGNDGLWTTDARHCADALKAALAHV